MPIDEIVGVVRDGLTVAQAAEMLRVTKTTIRRWMAVGVGGVRLQHTRIGGRRKLTASQISEFVAVTSRDPSARPHDRETVAVAELLFTTANKNTHRR